VSFAYPGQYLSLSDVSFSARRGERLAILGANGTGKSTLLHLMDGLYFAHCGSITAFGEELTPERVERPPFGPRFRKEVGFLFQNSDAQLFCPSVEEELAFGPLQIGWTKQEILRRIEDTLDLLGIQGLRERQPHNLSAGEKKKVALASLLVLSPSVLLLDEPTAGLDPRSQGNLLELLNDLYERGMTLVTATHDLELLPHLADRVLVFGEDHRIAADGPAAEVLADTELLLSVNLIHAHRHRHGSVAHSHPHQHIVMHHHDHGGERHGH
jgi:cobalt/nickel transport system ATP-binding protein